MITAEQTKALARDLVERMTRETIEQLKREGRYTAQQLDRFAEMLLGRLNKSLEHIGPSRHSGDRTPEQVFALLLVLEKALRPQIEHIVRTSLPGCVDTFTLVTAGMALN